jgi:hypothetical protein
VLDTQIASFHPSNLGEVISSHSGYLGEVIPPIPVLDAMNRPNQLDRERFSSTKSQIFR